MKFLVGSTKENGRELASAVSNGLEEPLTTSSESPSDAAHTDPKPIRRAELAKQQLVHVLYGFAHLSTTTVAFMWPERSRLHFLSRFRTWSDIYDFNFSAMDIWLQAVSFHVVLVIGLVVTQRRISKSGYGAPVMPVSPSIPFWFKSSCFICECFLLAKFVGIMYGLFRRQDCADAEGGTCPHHIAKESWLCLSLFASGVLTVATCRTSCRILSTWRDVWADSVSLRMPLLYEEFKREQDELREKKDKEWRAITSLWNFAKVDSPILAVALFCGCIASLATVSISYCIGKIVHYASQDGSSRHRAATHDFIMKLFVAVICCSVFTSIRGGLFTWTGARLNKRIRSRLFKSLLGMEQGYFDTTKTGELSSRLNTDTTTMSNQISLNINVLVRSIVQIAFVIGIMLWTSWQLTMVTITMVPFSAVIAHVYGRFYRKVTKKTQDSLAGASGVADEALASMSTVKSMAGEHLVERAYDKKLDEFIRLQGQESGAYAAYASLMIFCPNAAMLATLAIGAYMALHNRIQSDSLYSFILYQQTLGSAFGALGDIYSGISAALGAADKVFELIDRKPKMKSFGSHIPASFKGKIDLTNVTFRYPCRVETCVLENFSLAIKPDSTVALVGPSGSGKSSIIKLIERLYDPESGAVSLDGVHISAFDKAWLCRKMALVGQEPVLFGASIKENIEYGLDGPHKPSMDEIITAAKRANAHDFIMALQHGYDTQCGEKGMQLSGGQKQRIAIARAIVRNPQILLLDEATSALDTESEGVVQEALDKMIAEGSRTVVIVAHRLSTIQGADDIVVIKRGHLEEQGTHDNLLLKGGLYSRLVRKQMQRHPSSTTSLVSLAKE